MHHKYRSLLGGRQTEIMYWILPFGEKKLYTFCLHFLLLFWLCVAGSTIQYCLLRTIIMSLSCSPSIACKLLDSRGVKFLRQIMMENCLNHYLQAASYPQGYCTTHDLPSCKVASKGKICLADLYPPSGSEHYSTSVLIFHTPGCCGVVW